MAVTIRQLHKHFFGEVSGVDLRKPLTAEEARDIEAGMDKYAVLLFRDQDITDEQQLVFARNFGERESARGGTVTKREDYRLTSGLNDVSNLGKDGKPLPRDHRTHLFNLGNCLWHSDSSFRPIPAKFSLLSARVVNPKGGNTEFADMRAAYDALDDDVKAEIEALNSDVDGMLAAQAAAEGEGDIDVDDLSVDVAGTIESQAETDETPADEAAADTTDEA